MKNFKIYGKEPFKVVTVHGGPGGAGEMMPVAKHLSFAFGVIEPFQTQDSISKQIRELKDVLLEKADLPIVLIGHSWGAFLSLIFTAKYSSFVAKLILIGSGPLEEKYVSSFKHKRNFRLSEKEKIKLNSLKKALQDPTIKNKNSLFEKLGKLMFKLDSFDPILDDDTKIDADFNIFQKVDKEAKELRRSGNLLSYAKKIKCPVVAIHGEYDPHPFEGVKKPLSKLLDDFSFILLKECGHTPWREKRAKDKFYQILKDEIFGALF